MKKDFIFSGNTELQKTLFWLIDANIVMRNVNSKNLIKGEKNWSDNPNNEKDIITIKLDIDFIISI